MADAKKVDVFICGGGPVGLLLSYQLTRLGVSVFNIEKHDQVTQATYGRAAAFYPRTLEMLDQLDLADALMQIGFVCRRAVTYDRYGNNVQGRGWTYIHRISDTYYDYMLNIRQRFMEDVFRQRAAAYGTTVHHCAKLVDFALIEAEDDYRIEAKVEVENGKSFTVKAKYIVGADGGKSSVRQIAGIPIPGERTTHHWIRLDADIKTNMPLARIGIGSLESPTHGNVLWVALDHSATRIGFALTPPLFAKYGRDITEDDVRREAIVAVAPFSLEIITVHWWTLYSIQQKVADRFQDRGRILLAGDAGHVHSSGAAQGLNTGVHDAVNLAWKLGGVVKGWYTDKVLETYSPERRATALQLIALDKTIADLMSGKLPDGYSETASHSGDPNLALGDHQQKYAEFMFGLGIQYNQGTVLNRICATGHIRPGHRAPDAAIRKPGMTIPTRLYEITKNNGRFWIIIFAGRPEQTKANLQALRAYMDSPDCFTKRLSDVFNFATIVAGTGLAVHETLGIEPFGNVYYDNDESVHNRYGAIGAEGGIVVLRPDGILGFAAPLDDGVEVGCYFDMIVIPRAIKTETKSVHNNAKAEVYLNSDGTLYGDS